MDLYADNVLDHYRHPRHAGPLANATVSHREENASCGDDLTVHLLIDDGRIATIRWEGTGCAISQAAMSMLAEAWEGKTVEELESLSKTDIETMLGVPIGPRRFKCAFLGLHTLKNALRLAGGKKPQSWLETVEIEN